MEALQKIVAFLDLQIPENTVKNQVARMLYGKGPTFRSGQIYQWKSEFSPALKRLFQEKYVDDLNILQYEEVENYANN